MNCYLYDWITNQYNNRNGFDMGGMTRCQSANWKNGSLKVTFLIQKTMHSCNLSRKKLQPLPKKSYIALLNANNDLFSLTNKTTTTTNLLIIIGITTNYGKWILLEYVPIIIKWYITWWWYRIMIESTFEYSFVLSYYKYIRRIYISLVQARHWNISLEQASLTRTAKYLLVL